MEILQLTYFCHAANCENFSKTAEHYNVPTSNISRAVRSLESELGVKLFQRTANKVTLNEQGKIFYEHAKESLSLLEAGKKVIHTTTDGIRGEIKLLISTCRRIVTEAIAECRKRYPDIKFSVKHGTENGTYDFIISDISPFKKPFDKIHLMTEKMLLAVPANSPLLISKNIQESIENEHFISLGKGTRLHTITEQFCNMLGFRPNIEIETDDPYYVRKYLEMGLGIAVFPAKSWEQTMPKNVKLIDVGFPLRKNNVFIEKGKQLTPAEKIFLEILISTFENA